MGIILPTCVSFMQVYVSLLLATILTLCDKTVSYNSSSWRPEDFPDPLDTSDTRCNDIIRGRLSYVCDPGHILSEYERFSLGEEAYEMRSSPDCDCDVCGTKSFQIFVAIVPKIENILEIPSEGTMLSEKVINFSDYLKDTKYAKYTTCDQIAVIVISKDDRLVHVNMGTGARDIIPAGCADTIFDEASWDYSDFYPGLSYLLRQYYSVVEGERSCAHYKLDEPEGSSNGTFNIVNTLGGLAIMGLLVLVICFFKNGGCEVFRYGCDRCMGGAASPQARDPPEQHYEIAMV